MNKLLQVKCPQCDTSFKYYESPFRPFCCERCKMIDLGHWFEESYKVPLKEKILENEGQEYDQEDYRESYEENYQDDEIENEYDDESYK